MLLKNQHNSRYQAVSRVDLVIDSPYARSMSNLQEHTRYIWHVYKLLKESQSLLALSSEPL